MKVNSRAPQVAKKKSAGAEAQILLGLNGPINRLRKNSLYEGHGFSRAAKDHARDAALAAGVRIQGH